MQRVLFHRSASDAGMTLHTIRHRLNAPDAPTTSRRRSLCARNIWITVLAVALLQGIFYLFLIPPWQHYDEPTHFEYAWLFAQLGHPPTHGDQDQAMRRTVALSMQEHHFYHNLAAPALDGDYVDIGLSQLDHPPAYYALVSLPLRFTHHLEITTQLYVARSVSLLLFVATIAIATGLMSELTPPGHLLRLAVPLIIALFPSVADVMTAVNNDAGAVAAASLLLWGMVRMLRMGLAWHTIAWVVVAALLVLLTKNTAALLVVLVPLAFLVAVWIQQGWSWRWFAGAAVALGVVLVLAVVGWGDAAGWYHWNDGAAQASPTRIAHPDAPVGPHAVMLVATPQHDRRRLVNPLLHEEVAQTTGQTITAGGWVWADRPLRIEALGIAPAERVGYAVTTFSQPITLTTRPTFVAWHFNIPPQMQAVHYVFSAPPPGSDGQPYRVFLDGAVLVSGTFPTDTAPVFDDATASSGTWSGQPFTNLLRHGAAEEAWPRLRPWVESTLDQVISLGGGRTPSQLLAALWDVERSSAILARYGGFLPLDGMVTGFGWGNVRLDSAVWVSSFRGVVLIALLGCLTWVVLSSIRRSDTRAYLRPALLVLALAGAGVWATTLLRVLPQMSEGFVWPVARYTFPAIIPTTLALVGGWWAVWPRPYRGYAVVALIAGMILLNSAALLTIWSFFSAMKGDV